MLRRSQISLPLKHVMRAPWHVVLTLRPYTMIGLLFSRMLLRGFETSSTHAGWAGKENRRFPDNYKNVGTWTGVSATIIFTQIAKYGVREKECLTREERAARQTRIAFVDWSHEAKAVSELCEG